MSYLLTCRQVDKVVRVPSWASDYLKAGDLVFRTADDNVISKRGNLALGKSYTKKLGYASPSADTFEQILHRLEHPDKIRIHALNSLTDL